MNEESRLESTQIKEPIFPEKNSEKDYSKYFQASLHSTILKRCKKTWQRRSNLPYTILQLQNNLKRMGKNRKFYIRTYGCQMNEHDTEVMAGIFMQLGYEPTDTVEDANVVLLNTCAIRENAENKVFGELGHFKQLKQKKSRCINWCLWLYVPRRISCK